MHFISFLQPLIAVVALCALMLPVVAAHELGHFAAARILGIRVATFSVGFGAELFGWTDSRGTRWKVSAIPLGGYVAFAGRLPPAEMGEGLFARLFAVPGGDDFTRSRPGRRLVVLLAGPAASVAFSAAVFFFAWLAFGVPQGPLTISSVEAGGAAALAGVEPGDVLVSVGGFDAQRTILETIAASAGRTLPFVTERSGRRIAFDAEVGSKPIHTPIGDRELGFLGIAIEPPPRRFDPIGAARLASGYMAFLAASTVDFFRDALSGRVSRQDLSSPVGIAAVSGNLIQRDREMFVRFGGAISFGLGVSNMLPIPGLDGGLSLIALLEALRRRPFSKKALARVSLGGLMAVCCILLAVMSHEVTSILGYAFGG